MKKCCSLNCCVPILVGSLVSFLVGQLLLTVLGLQKTLPSITSAKTNLPLSVADMAVT